MKQSAVMDYRIYFSTTNPETETDSEVLTEEVVESPWRLILYNDDIHTFDEVINQLIKAIKCSVSEAESIAWTVHNEGKATVFEGTFEECMRVNSILLEIQLITEIKG